MTNEVSIGIKSIRLELSPTGLFARNFTHMRAAKFGFPFPVIQVKEHHERGRIPCSWSGEKLSMRPPLCFLLQ